MSAFTAHDLLDCYARGVFPMADARDDEATFLIDPERRGIIPLDGFHLSRRLARTVRAEVFEVRIDTVFPQVVEACAQAAPGRPETWINGQIEQAYNVLHRNGHAHSIEVWCAGDIGGVLVGGLYGVSLGGAFFGESMFSRMSDASKIGLAHLVARLRVGGYRLLDCQFITDHLASLGAIEIGRSDYRALLDEALGAGVAAAAGSAPASPALSADFFAIERAFPPATEEAMTVSGPISGCVIAQLLGHTS